MWRSLQILNVLSTSTMTQAFWKTETPFKKLEKSFLFESNTIENATFSYKTAFSRASVKTNKVGVQNGPIKKNGVLALTSLFLKIQFHFKNLQAVNLVL